MTKSCQRHMTPYESVTGRKPDISYMRVFGSKCYIPLNNRRKMENVRVEGRLLGYRHDSPSYIVEYLDAVTGQLVIRYNVNRDDVKFDERSARREKEMGEKAGLENENGLLVGSNNGDCDDDSDCDSPDETTQVTPSTLESSSPSTVESRPLSTLEPGLSSTIEPNSSSTLDPTSIDSQYDSNDSNDHAPIQGEERNVNKQSESEQVMRSPESSIKVKKVQFELDPALEVWDDKEVEHDAKQEIQMEEFPAKYDEEFIEGQTNKGKLYGREIRPKTNSSYN